MCQKYKPFTSYNKNKFKRRGIAEYCKACLRSYTATWQAKRKRLGICLKCRKKCIRGSVSYCAKHRLRQLNTTRAWNANIKAKVFRHYGNKCKCCGEMTPQFLTIDHIKNDGNKDRARGKSGYPYYAKLVSLGFPKSVQVLCMNCNFGKMINKGTCPHGRTRHSRKSNTSSIPAIAA